MALKPGYWPSALLLVRYSVRFWSTPDSPTVYLRTVYAGSLLPPACCPGPSTRSAQFRLARSRASVPLLNRTAEVSQHTEVELSRCSFLSSMPLLLSGANAGLTGIAGACVLLGVLASAWSGCPSFCRLLFRCRSDILYACLSVWRSEGLSYDLPIYVCLCLWTVSAVCRVPCCCLM